jgi:hypothetical protein
VEIGIIHCGACHSDIHLIDNDWGFSSYPLVRVTTESGLSARRGRLEATFGIGIGIVVGFAAERITIAWSLGPS